MSAYDSMLGKREVEGSVADTFEAEFPMVTGRKVEILSRDETPDYVAPDCLARIDGIETGVELTSIHAGDADSVVTEVLRLAHKKHVSYERRGLFSRPMILLGHLDWPSPDVEGIALFDVCHEIEHMTEASDFDKCGFSEIWLMDAGAKYTSRKDPRCPADFYCFAPADTFGFWERERKRRPYWSFLLDHFS